jgi:hypothetical protein
MSSPEETDPPEDEPGEETDDDDEDPPKCPAPADIFRARVEDLSG